MAFQEYVSSRGRRGDATVGIQSNGLICLNSTVLKLVPVNLSRVKLLYDPDMNHMGIRPCNGDESGLKATSSKSGRAICGWGFKKYFNLSLPAGRYLPRWDKGSKMLIVDLNSPEQ